MWQSDSQPVSFLTLEEGTPVVDRFGRAAGEVERVLLFEGGGFDGMVVRTRSGARFVDAPEVRRISGGAATLGITVDEVEHAAADDQRRYGVPAARYGGTEGDRDAVIEGLKGAFVRDELTTEVVAVRVAIAHLAETLDELEAALADQAHR